MRGRKSGHRCALPSPAPQACREDGMRVLTDLVDSYPVSAAELDAIEAFLMPLIRQIVADEMTPDSEEPQCRAKMRRNTAEDQGREILLQDPAR
jgi:hypothetical protein